MNDILFDDPSYPVPETLEEVREFADTCRRQPGRWALYGAMTAPGSTVRMTAYIIRKGGHSLRGKVYSPKMFTFGPPGSFEAQTITMLGEHRIYARFVGIKETETL